VVTSSGDSFFDKNALQNVDDDFLSDFQKRKDSVTRGRSGSTSSTGKSSSAKSFSTSSLFSEDDDALFK